MVSNSRTKDDAPFGGCIILASCGKSDLENLSETTSIELKPSVDPETARMKSMDMVWKGIAGEIIG